MPKLTIEKLKKYQRRTFRLDPDLCLKNTSQAVHYVNERGFIFFWPIKDIQFPSLWTAVAGDRPVADEHDDPGHVTWRWKDELLDKRVWYYARMLKKKNAMISMECLPYFYALSPNYGDPEQDYLDQYEQGNLSMECKVIYEALLKQGPLDTISLRGASHLQSSKSASPFNTALATLQQQMRVLPVGICEAGSWRYAFVYDLVHRYYPQLIETARKICESDAIDTLLTKYFLAVGISRPAQVSSFLGYPLISIERSFIRLTTKGVITAGVQIENQVQEHYCFTELLSSSPE